MLSWLWSTAGGCADLQRPAAQLRTVQGLGCLLSGLKLRKLNKPIALVSLPRLTNHKAVGHLAKFRKGSLQGIFVYAEVNVPDKDCSLVLLARVGLGSSDCGGHASCGRTDLHSSVNEVLRPVSVLSRCSCRAPTALNKVGCLSPRFSTSC